MHAVPMGYGSTNTTSAADRRTTHITEAGTEISGSTWPHLSGATSGVAAGRRCDVSSWPDAASATPHEAASGRVGRVGRYLLIEPIGAGSQAVVWRAVAERPRARLVALKMLAAPHRGDPRRIAQLRREALRGALLSHPALLPVEEFGADDGAVYLVMPLVEGCSLAGAIARRRERGARPGGTPTRGGHWLVGLPGRDYLRAVCGLLASIARGVQVAHEARVAHRDIKPSNILLEWGDAGRAFLADFGLGRDLDVATPEQLRDGSGTAMYMAPERLRREPADEVLGDVYSLGVTLYEAATLARPFPIPPYMHPAAALAHMARIVARPPLRPRAARPGLPAALEAIILRAMARDPRDRFPSAGALAEALERAIRPGRGRASGEPGRRGSGKILEEALAAAG